MSRWPDLPAEWWQAAIATTGKFWLLANFGIVGLSRQVAQQTSGNSNTGFLMQRTKTHRVILRCLTGCYALQLCLVGWSLPTYGDSHDEPDWRDDVGYTKLISILGNAAPNGEGVPVSLVEAVVTVTEDSVVVSRSYKPDPTLLQFSSASDPLVPQQNTNLIDGSSNFCGIGTPCIGFSTHATSQAVTIVGNSLSAAPGANNVTYYNADDYLDDILNRSGSNSVLPETQDFRVQNFSWIASYPNANQERETLRRFDYSIDSDNITAVVGLNNNTNPLPSLLSHSYNSIAVGRTDGVHSSGLTLLANYGVGRSKPDLVAPQSTTSAATSSVSSIATFLHSADTVLGTDAVQSETMKAILLAGATKDEFSSWSQIDSGGQWRPLDDTYGAGEVNLLNSYLVTLGGRTAGSTGVAAPVTSYGWDYQTVQSGAGNTLLYDFVIPTGSSADELSIVLTWNAKIATDSGSGNPLFGSGEPIVANLDLELVDANGNTVDSVFSTNYVEGLSASDVDNVEHLYLTSLDAGTYTLKVSSEDLVNSAGEDILGSALESEFGLAWRTSRLFGILETDFDTDGDTDGADFLAWQRGFGTPASALQNVGDADGDNDVDADDLAIISTSFGPESIPPPTSLAILAVPEPASWILIFVGLFLAFGLRQHPIRSSLNRS